MSSNAPVNTPLQHFEGKSLNVIARKAKDMLMENVAPHTCKYCGDPSWVDPSDQLPPLGTCWTVYHGYNTNENTFPYKCKYCGEPSLVDPSDQLCPPDKCWPIDHGME